MFFSFFEPLLQYTFLLFCYTQELIALQERSCTVGAEEEQEEAMSVYDRPTNRIPAWVVAIPLLIVFALIGAEIAYVSSRAFVMSHQQISSQYRQ